MSSASSVPVFQDKLYTLEAALNPLKMSPYLTSLVREKLDENLEVRHIGIEVIRRRNQRCVIRYLVEAFDSHTERRMDWRIIGKVYKANRGERVYEIMQQLWEHGFSRATEDGICIPEPLDFSSPLCMLFQEEVPGLPLKTLIKHEPEPVHFRQLARILAKLHQCPLIPDEPFLVKNHLLRCHPRYPFLAMASPDLETKIDYIVETAQKIETELIHDAKLTPIHGDFHLGQILLENGHAWLIDFDALSYGDPAADLGNLLVFMRSKAKKNPDVAKLITVFLDEYFSIMDREIGERVILYEGLTHLRRACKSLRLQEEGWRRKVQRQIEKGVECIEQIGKNGALTEGDLAIVADDEDADKMELTELN